MVLSEKLLEKLVCPECKDKLDYQQEQERLVCSSCGIYYRITNNVPVLLKDEAEKL